MIFLKKANPEDLEKEWQFVREMPLFYEKNNICGTLNMMEAARQCGVKKFVLMLLKQLGRN